MAHVSHRNDGCGRTCKEQHPLPDVLIARRLLSHCCHGSGRGGREGTAVAVAPRSAGGDGVPQHGNPAAPGQPALLSRCQQCQRVPLPDGPLLWGDRLLHLLLRAVVVLALMECIDPVQLLLCVSTSPG
ncbi:hypothetical protein Q7C36_018892 [Tachysurus vachellii]|uniref:Uncharacterized protein n=1 Tax=Tachysurus vachellii TaxID=175792 RepID=A0AA88LVK1_TACVA|nr:hypothetical protein Q7C36_018892 [Tachysurus vachellii]